MVRHEDGTYTVAYVVIGGDVVDEADTVADAARAAAAGGQRWEDHERHPGGWYVECWTYDEDGTPITDHPVDVATVRQAFHEEA